MKRFLRSEAGAAVLCVLLALVLAAVLAPWLYQAGKSLAGAAESQELPWILEWLGAACGRASFGRFFNRSLALSAVAVLPLLFQRVRAVRAANGCGAEPCVRVPWQSALIQIGVGCLVAGGMLWGIAMLMEAQGAFAPRLETPGFGKLMGKILVPALVVPPFEEWLIRGVLLGLWLRCSKPFTACVGSSLFFAFIHFLKLPDSSAIADPSSALAGFQLLGKVLLQFADPRFFIADFASLFFIGMILAWARLRTGALWFSIGLHAGWIVAFKGFNLLYQPVANPPWGIGETVRSGLFPMITLGLTSVICYFVLRRFAARPSIS